MKSYTTLYETRIQTKKKVNCAWDFNHLQWLKPYIEFNTQERIEAAKKADIGTKELYKLRSNAVCGETMKNFRNWINLKLWLWLCLKWASKQYFMCYKTFCNDFAVILKSKVTLTINPIQDAGKPPISFPLKRWN